MPNWWQRKLQCKYIDGHGRPDQECLIQQSFGYKLGTIVCTCIQIDNRHWHPFNNTYVKRTFDHQIWQPQKFLNYWKNNNKWIDDCQSDGYDDWWPPPWITSTFHGFLFVFMLYIYVVLSELASHENLEGVKYSILRIWAWFLPTSYKLLSPIPSHENHRLRSTYSNVQNVPRPSQEQTSTSRQNLPSSGKPSINIAVSPWLQWSYG